MPRYACSFENADVVTIPGSVHRLQTADFGVFVYQGVGTLRSLETGTVSIDSLTADCVITFLQLTTGRVVLIA